MFGQRHVFPRLSDSLANQTNRQTIQPKPRAGYDVWLGNVRANSYSRNHTQLEPSDPAFWAFTWDDIAAKVGCVLLDNWLAGWLAGWLCG